MEKVIEIGKALKKKSKSKAKQLEGEYQEILEKLEQHLIELSNNKLTQIENNMKQSVEKTLKQVEIHLENQIEKRLETIETEVMKTLLSIEAREEEYYQYNKLRQEAILESLGVTLTLEKTQSGEIVIKEKPFKDKTLKEKLFGGK